MSGISEVARELRSRAEEFLQLANKLEDINLDGKPRQSRSVKATAATVPIPARRKLSAAGRAAIVRAQRERWRKIRAGKKAAANRTNMKNRKAA